MYVLNIERADDTGLHFDSKPFKEKADALAEARKRVETFKDDITREFVKDGYEYEEKDSYVYCTANWTMSLYIYCKIAEHEV